MLPAHAHQLLLAILLLAPAVSAAAGVTFLTAGGGGDSTNWQAVVYSLTNGAALGETAWQNPASAADWTWTSNGREITLTGYSGPNAVVIPDMLDGLPVTGFGGIFSGNQDITSVGGGANVKAVDDYAFFGCWALNSVSLPACTTVGNVAISYCAALNSVSLPACTTVGDSAFETCGSLTSVSLPACTTVGDSAFYGCENLSSVTFGQNAPAQAADVFEYSTPTIYVSNPHATGWGDTWNGRPVVRLPLYGSSVTAQAFTLGGDTITEWPEGGGSVPYTDWTGTVMPQNGTATVTYAHGNMPVLVVPDGGGITYVTIATDTYAATSGVSRVSLSIWAGANTIELVTNEVDYATAPDIPTNGWGTILFRRVSNEKWKGVGL